MIKNIRNKIFFLISMLVGMSCSTVFTMTPDVIACLSVEMGLMCCACCTANNCSVGAKFDHESSCLLASCAVCIHTCCKQNNDVCCCNDSLLRCNDTCKGYDKYYDFLCCERKLCNFFCRQLEPCMIPINERFPIIPRKPQQGLTIYNHTLNLAELPRAVIMRNSEREICSYEDIERD